MRPGLDRADQSINSGKVEAEPNRAHPCVRVQSCRSVRLCNDCNVCYVCNVFALWGQPCTQCSDNSKDIHLMHDWAAPAEGRRRVGWRSWLALPLLFSSVQSVHSVSVFSLSPLLSLVVRFEYCDWRQQIRHFFNTSPYHTISFRFLFYFLTVSQSLSVSRWLSGVHD